MKDGLTTLELHELDEACRPIKEAFEECPYLVGSIMEGRNNRDVDVRLILSDEQFDTMFKNNMKMWAFLSRVISTYLRGRTGLPVDFQIQKQSVANTKHPKPRNPLGLRSLDQYAGGGDATK